MNTADATREPDVSEALQQQAHVAEVGSRALRMAHRLNNELNIVLAYANLLLEELPDDSEHRDFAERVCRSGQRAAAAVRTILDGEPAPQGS